MEPYPHRHLISALQDAAREIDIPINAPARLISIDHDYRYPSPDLTTWQDHPKAEYLTTGLKWHVEEWWSQERAMRAWTEYADRLRAIGEDPLDYAREDIQAKEDVVRMKDLHPGQFGIYGGDSHLWSLVVAIALYESTGKALHIVHYDAHHDCGYHNYPGDDPKQSQERARTQPACDDWIQAAIWLGIVDKVDIIYPAWQGMVEWYHRQPTLAAAQQDLVHALTAPTWFAMDHPQDFDGVITYIRSSAFFPPWSDYDQRYLGAVESWSAGWHNLDSINPGQLVMGSANAGMPRAGRLSESSLS